MSSMMVTRDLSYVPKLRIRHPPPPTTYRRIRSGLYSYLRSVEKSSATYCLAIELIQSRYGAEMSAVPNRRICSTVDSSIFTPNLSRTAFFAAIMHWFTPKFFCPASALLSFLIVDIQNVHGSVSDICKEIGSLEISELVYDSRIPLWVKTASRKAEMILFAVKTVMDFWILEQIGNEKLLFDF